MIYLVAGDMYPAVCPRDCLQGFYLSASATYRRKVQPLEKCHHAVNKDSENPLELPNLAFMGSNVVSGSATCIVLGNR